MLKHNKKKNSQIIYEQLMTLATRLAMTKKINESKLILKIIKDHYAPTTELGREKKLFDSILEAQNMTRERADALLTEVLNEARMMKEQPLEREKVILINKIIKEIGKDLFSIPIKEYKFLASVQILFNETRNNFRYSKPVERVKIKNILVENMSRKVESADDGEEIDNFTYNLLIKKFNDKYGSVMNEDQRHILSGWIDYLFAGNEKNLINLLENKRANIKATIQASLINETHNNSEYKEMLEEAASALSKDFEKIDEDIIYETIRYFDLLDDLEEAISGKDGK